MRTPRLRQRWRFSMVGHSGMGMTDTVEVKPGTTGELTVTFDKAGDVLIGCHQPGHYPAGMRATVTVST
jgi:uncharacterized cupredoxin-like copper-binding protein